MKSLDNVKLLFCFNKTGEEKVNEVLNELLSNPEYIQVSTEQLEQELKEQKKQDNAKLQEKEVVKKRKAEEKEISLKALQDKYKKELKMIEQHCFPVSDFDMIDAIRARNESQFVTSCNVFTWGYIQGKRAERARRKKVAQ